MLRDAFFFLFGCSAGFAIAVIGMVAVINASLKRDPEFWINKAAPWRDWKRRDADQPS